MPKITLYHYTSSQGALGIRKDSVIEGSTDATPKKNRRHGKGVYFTSLDPYNNPKAIILNNYDDAGRAINSKKLWNRIQWVVEVTIPEDDLEKVDGVGNRDIYLYPGDVALGHYQYRIYENPRQ